MRIRAAKKNTPRYIAPRSGGVEQLTQLKNPSQSVHQYKSRCGHAASQNQNSIHHNDHTNYTVQYRSNNKQLTIVNKHNSSTNVCIQQTIAFVYLCSRCG